MGLNNRRVEYDEIVFSSKWDVEISRLNAMSHPRVCTFGWRLFNF